MPISTTFHATPSPLRVLSLHHPTTNHIPFLSPPSPFLTPPKPTSLRLSLTHSPHRPLFIAFSTNASATNSEVNTKLSGSGGSGENGSNNGGGGGYGGSGDGDEGNDDKNKRNNKEEALMALAEAGRSLESLPKDLKAAIEEGRIPGSIILRYLDLEKSNFLSWLMKFGGFKERLLADDLFLAKVAMECGVGVFTKVVECTKILSLA